MFVPSFVMQPDAALCKREVWDALRTVFMIHLLLFACRCVARLHSSYENDLKHFFSKFYRRRSLNTILA